MTIIGGKTGRYYLGWIYGTTSAPTAAATYATLPEMTATIRHAENEAILVHFNGIFEGSSTSGTLVLKLDYQGNAITSEYTIEIPVANKQFLVSFSALIPANLAGLTDNDSATISVQWKETGLGTITATGTMRDLYFQTLKQG